MADQKPTIKTSSTPPLEAEPSFQERTMDALGGNPTNPTKFQSIAPGTASAPGVTSEQAKPSRKMNTSFDVDPVAEAHRSNISNLRLGLGSIVQAIDTKGELVRAGLAKLISTDEGKAEAQRQGFDVKQVQSFLDQLDKAVDSVKPKES